MFDAHLLRGMIKEGLDLILTEGFVVLRGRDGPRLFEPLDTPRVDARVEAMFAQEQTILKKERNNALLNQGFSTLMTPLHKFGHP